MEMMNLKTKIMSSRTKIILSIIIFVAVVATLMGVASVYDLEISHALSESALPDGAYLATDFFGLYGEIIGSIPVFMVILFVASFMFLYFMKVWKLKPLKYVFALICFAVGVVGAFFILEDVLKYILEHAGNEKFVDNAAVIASLVTLALMVNVITILACNNMKTETIKKLAKFAIAAAIVLAITNVLVAVLKVPVGRIRYRAMNWAEADASLKDLYGFAAYVPWYEMNGQPTEAVLNIFADGLWPGINDAFKSFPSGHTNAAAMGLVLIMLPDVLNFKNKGVKVACWVVPIVVAILIGISRVVCGAHFLSDTVFSGALAFATVITVRELIICKGSHLKALFCKKAVAEIATETGVVNEVEVLAESEAV